MPLPGGSTSKFGNRYEGRWTVLQLIEVLREHASAIYLEPPAEDGCEFIIHKGVHKEYHQVKRQNSTSGRWNLYDLARVGVIKYFKTKLVDPNSYCIFISSNSAYQLDELSDRAQRAGSFARFDAEFLSTDNWRGDFLSLCELWELTNAQQDAFEYLKRIEIRTVDENTLIEILVNAIEPLIEGEPSSIQDILAEFVLDNVNKSLDAHQIWQHLEHKHGLKKRIWAKDHLVLSAVSNLFDQFASPIAWEMILQNHLPSPETAKIIETLNKSSWEKKGVMLVGEAGIGKSCLILEVLETLRKKNWPIIPIRITTVEPVANPRELGRQLSLPGSPVHVLSEICNGKPGLLLIDQLDAISLISGRNPSFFECFDALIHQTSQYENIRVLVACRKFDLENDYRFKRLCGQNGILVEITANKFPKDRVIQIVNQLGFNASRLSQKQIDLLSLPVHLKLLSQVAVDKNSDVLSFSTAKELFDHFWVFKQKVLRSRMINPSNWVAIIDQMCEYMNQNQQLSVPENILDNWQADAMAMVSEHALLAANRRILFFHESFFDYCFARRFFANKHTLSEFLKTNEQHIFKRAQCRQILIQQREDDYQGYLSNLRELLSGNSYRFHIKDAVISVISGLPDPKDEELNIVLEIIKVRDDIVGDHLFRAISNSPNWFDIFDIRGFMTNWVESNDTFLEERAVNFLSNVSRQRHSRVATLIGDKAGKSEAWNNRVLLILFYADISVSQDLFNVLLKCIQLGLFDEDKETAGARDIGHILYSVKEGKSNWVCEAIGIFFKRFYSERSKSLNNADKNWGNALPSSQIDDILIKEAAQKAPIDFVENLLPLIQNIVEDTITRDKEMPYLDRVFYYRQYGGAYSMPSALISAMESALQVVAKSDPHKLRGITADIKEKDSDTMQFLIIRAYTGNGAEFANEAIEYLCERSSRLHCGYISDSYWASRLLIKSIGPYCTPTNFSKLENHILGYYSKWEKSSKGYRSRGIPQLTLLNGLPASRMSIRTAARLDEWRRKFRISDVEPPEPLEVKSIGSPVPEQARQKMSDQQWQKAISRYSKESHDFTNGDFKGGAHELSGLLEQATKENPERFAHLGMQLPSGSHPYYFDAILRGLKDSASKLNYVLPFCFKCHELPGRPCGRWIHGPIAKFAEEPIPEEAIKLIAWYATEDPDPDKELWRTKTPSGSVYYSGDILTAAINSARGTACESLALLIYHDKSRIEALGSTIDKIVEDPSITVRCTAASVLISIYRYKPIEAVDLFLKMCNCDEIILGTHFVERFLYFALRLYYSKLEAILLRMINSTINSVIEAGSRQMCIAAFDHPSARKYAEKCIEGNLYQQKGAAQVCAANIIKTEFRSFCESGLKRLFNSVHKEVQNEAKNCFRNFSGDMIGNYNILIEQYIESPAFQDDPYQLMYALDGSTAKIPEVIFKVSERKISDFKKDKTGRIRSRVSFTDTICKLLMRVYCQTNDESLRSHCLDCFDELLKLGIYGVHEVIALQDR
jgi:hypothetical protein